MLTVIPQAIAENPRGRIRTGHRPRASRVEYTALLKAIAQDLNLKEKTGPAIEGELAEVVNALLKDKMSAEALKAKIDNYVHPENIEELRTPKVNPLIWNQISASMRTQDAGSQKNQNTLVASMIAMAKAADIVMKNMHC